MPPGLPDDPNIAVLPSEFAVCLAIIAIGLAALYARERRLPDGSSHPNT